MAYIAEVPGNLLTFELDAWVIDTNTNNVLNGFFSNSQETTGDISATNQGGDGSVAESGETVTVPTAGGEISGEYAGPVVLSTQNVSVGIPTLANLNIKLNDIEGHLIRAEDGTTYIVTDDPVTEDHLGATATITVLGQDFSVDAPVSEILDALTNQIDAAGQAAYDAAYQVAYNTAYAAGFLLPPAARVAAAQLAGQTAGTTAQAPWSAASGLIQGAANLVQDALDVVVINVAEGDDALAVVCFAAGTLIATERGEVAIEELRSGDLVFTRDNGLQPIRWIGSRKLRVGALQNNPKLQPIRIKAGALGTGVPAMDLLVSPQHRVLVRSTIAQKMFGTAEVLVAAKQLVLLDGIDIAEDVQEVEYFHMLFDGHEVVISNGAETESLYTGPEALKSVGKAALEEIFALFPDLADPSYVPQPARHLPSGRQARKMGMRHRQNNRPLLTPSNF